MLVHKCFASYLSRLTPRFFFSRTLSDSAQRALWASKIVKEIINASPHSNSSPSLREKLTKLQLNIQDYSFDTEIRNSVMKLFTTGIKLDSDVFDQVRIKNAQQARSGLFIFCPNYLVTKQMFQYLKTEDQNILIRGAYGTGKTISIVLFIHLASMINQFRFQAFYDKSLTKTKELEQLKKMGLIEFLPKLYYWSVDKKNKELPIEQLVLSQAHELSNRQLRRLKKLPLQKLPKSLTAYYSEAGIATNVVIDQINYIASNIRKWNSNIENQEIMIKKIDDQTQQTNKKYQQSILNTKQIFAKNWGDLIKLKLQHKEQCLNNRKDLSEQLKISVHLMNRLHQFQQYGRYSIFNSSANIQDKLLRNQYVSNVNIIKFKLFHSSEQFFINEKIKFQQNLQKQWGKTDFLQFFWFQLYRTLQGQGVSQEKISLLKLKFSEKTKQFTLKLHYRFLHIRSVIQRAKSKFKISQETSFDQINNFMEQCINKFEAFCKEEAITKISSFLEKGNQMEILFKKRFVSTLFYYASHLARTDRNIQINRQTLKTLLGVELSIQQILMYSNTHNKQMLPIMSMGEIDQYEELHQVLLKDKQDDNMENVVFIYSPLELIEMLAHAAISKLPPYTFQLNPLFQKFLENKAFCGIVYEGFFLGLFRCKKMRVSLSINDREKIFQIEHFTKFKAFKLNDTNKTFKNNQNINQTEPKQPDNPNLNTFEHNFENIISAGLEMPGKHISATPALLTENQIQLDSNDSESIDLLIGKYSEGKFIIDSIDVTVSTNYQKITQKHNKAINLFKTIFRRSSKKLKIEINHIIFCPKVMCENRSPYISSKIKIFFSPIQEFKILQNQVGILEKTVFLKVSQEIKAVEKRKLTKAS